MNFDTDITDASEIYNHMPNSEFICEPRVAEPELKYPAKHLRSNSGVIIDYTRDALIDKDGLNSFKKSYMYADETSPQEVYARVSNYFGSTPEHSQRLYDYMSKHWFHPATPILSNGGTKRGNVISCNVNEVQDNKESIAANWNENFWLATGGAGIGTYFGRIRSSGEKISTGTTNGAFPFMNMLQALVSGANQGSLRRANAAVYMPMWHPEIESFVKMRLATSGDPNRKLIHLHHGVMVSDAFMRAVDADADWDLKSPKTGEVIATIKARPLWISVLEARLERGEPYIVFADTVNDNLSSVYKANAYEIMLSNLCSEILLKTGIDNAGRNRTAVCCLSSLNLLYYNDWKNNTQFIRDVAEFLDNVISEYIDTAGPHYENATYAAMRERSIGVGVMGFHSFLQDSHIPFESAVASVWNKKMFKHIRADMDKASFDLAVLRGPCPDAAEHGLMERFANKMAVAPTASISTLCGSTSPGIEPIAANKVAKVTKDAAFPYTNPMLKKYLATIGKDTDEVWTSISLNRGSVQHLDFMPAHEKLVYKTARELDQRWLIEHAADRMPHIDQGQSVNLFFQSGVTKKHLLKIHRMAWKKGLKSLYYCRGESEQQAEGASNGEVVERYKQVELKTEDYEGCLACQ